MLGVALVPATIATANEQVVDDRSGKGRPALSLLSGTYGELFPQGTQARGDVAVLAIRSVYPDGRQVTEVVPATLDQDTEENGELVIEPETGVSYVFWQSWSNLLHSRFLVSSFDGQAWGDPIEVSGPGFVWRTSPAFAVTRDKYSELSVTGNGEAKTVYRTLLHVVWSEESEDGWWDTMYAPLVLENGEYIGSHPVLNLNDFVPETASAATSSNLRITPILRTQGDQSTVVAAFLDQRSGQVATVEIRFAAGELSILGDVVSDEIERSAGQERTMPSSWRCAAA